MSLGTVFISHKHKDKEIAKVLGDFMKDASGNRVEIYLSSDPRYKGTRAGESLPQELDKAISESGVVLLVYTGKSAKVDWEYCIYECAFARSRGIRVVIFQCVEEAPAPFLSTVRTLVSDKADVYKFAKDFLTSSDFLRDQKEPITAFSPDDPDVKIKADFLHQNLTTAIDQYLGKDPLPWSAWPSISVRFNQESMQRIAQSNGTDRNAVVRKELLEKAKVVDSAGADQIFGVGIDDNQAFEALFATWQESYQEQNPDWLDSICSQIEAFARKRYPQLREARLSNVQGKSNVIPVVTEMLSFPTSKEKDFNIQFYDMQSKSPPITEIMIGRDSIYYKSADPGDSSSLILKDLYRDMKKNGIFRLPVLDESGRFRSMIHRSVISEFLLDTHIDNATLHDLLAVRELKDTIDGTVAFVSASCTVAEAKEMLREVRGARDVFVTADGERTGAILGMATNTDLERSV